MGNAKKIGFVDLYISEWHANNYPKWINEACEKLGVDYKVAYAWAKVDKSPVYGDTTDEWCAKFGAEKCETVEELCEKSDVILVLAPTNPEVHLEFAEKVLPFGKRTYIDKTFAPDLATAEKIFAIAKEHGTPFFSSSALRYATELDDSGDVTMISTFGGGSNLPEYIIHQAEMVIKSLKAEPLSVKAEKVGGEVIFTAKFEGGKEAALRFEPAYPFGFAEEKKDGSKRFTLVQSDSFGGLITDILKFFETGKVPFDPDETLKVMKLRDLCLEAAGL